MQNPKPVMGIVAELALSGFKAEMETMTKLPNVQAAYVPGSLGMAAECGDAIASPHSAAGKHRTNLIGDYRKAKV